MPHIPQQCFGKPSRQCIQVASALKRGTQILTLMLVSVNCTFPCGNNNKPKESLFCILYLPWGPQQTQSLTLETLLAFPFWTFSEGFQVLGGRTEICPFPSGMHFLDFEVHSCLPRIFWRLVEPHIQSSAPELSWVLRTSMSKCFQVMRLFQGPCESQGSVASRVSALPNTGQVRWGSSSAEEPGAAEPKPSPGSCRETPVKPQRLRCELPPLGVSS